MDGFIPVLGIDFGTSNSKMAWCNFPDNQSNAQAEALENSDGDKVTPSIVYYGPGDQVLVGTPAADMLEDEQAWDQVIISVKRSMVKAPVINLADRTVKPVEVAAAILRKLKDDAQQLHFHQEVKYAVITCPATFDVLERDAIKKAGKLAGFSEVEILPEPMAAALAYTRKGFQVGNGVLIYDLGGGTFDLAVMARHENGFRPVLEPQGIKECGGNDFDDILYDYCDKLAREKLNRPISPEKGQRDLHFLYQCRKRKENLTASQRRSFSSLLAPNSVLFKYDLDRATFERLIHAKVEQTVQKTQAMIEHAQEKGCHVDTLILVGGASQIPLVKQLLDEKLPLKAMEWRYREVAVALGAAYHAHNRWNGSKEEQEQGGHYSEEAKHIWLDRQGTTRTSPVPPTIRIDPLTETSASRSTGVINPQTASPGGRTTKVVDPTGLENSTWTLTGHTSMIWCVAVSPMGVILASGSEDHTVRLWNPGNGQLIRSFDQYPGGVHALSFSPNGQLLASAGNDRTIKVWDLYTGQAFHTFTEQEAWLHINTLAISPDGRLLASGDREGNIRFRNLHSGIVLRPLTEHTGAVWDIAFSPDGQLLASSSADQTVRLWDLRQGRLLRVLNGHIGGVMAVAFSPNGQLVASAGDDRTIRFWNLRSGELLRPLLGHANSITSIAFSPDGQFLVSGSLDFSIRLWNLRDGRLVRVFSEHTGGVYSVAFSPDGKSFVSGSADATVKIWSGF